MKEEEDTTSGIPSYRIDPSIPVIEKIVLHDQIYLVNFVDFKAQEELPRFPLCAVDYDLVDLSNAWVVFVSHHWLNRFDWNKRRRSKKPQSHPDRFALLAFSLLFLNSSFEFLFPSLLHPQKNTK